MFPEVTHIVERFYEVSDPVAGPLRVEVCGRSHVGLVRTRNEDRLLVANNMFLVADGMGGHDCGDLAAQAVVDAFAPLGACPVTSQGDVEEAARLAHVAVEAIRGNWLRRPGSTVAGAALTCAPGAWYLLVFNIGDSRVYVHSDSVLEQVSVDHTEVEELLALGEISPEQALEWPRNVITRAIGGVHECCPPPDFALVPLTVGDTVLVCSDGLTDYVSDAEIAALIDGAAGAGAGAGVPGGSVAEVAALLEARALAGGGCDNVSVVVARAVG